MKATVGGGTERLSRANNKNRIDIDKEEKREIETETVRKVDK